MTVDSYQSTKNDAFDPGDFVTEVKQINSQ